ncbi:hypothetical protein N3K66_005204 [Trichothecium roseum]|uniref:Uncharacterized protein n=1 Tax=Trichothecium roseum TaxID=47278 RepID=A0ACC0V400_9HYPO|nr:hypothetical protein N3K66_005204 [Trichothecium roseum]
MVGQPVTIAPAPSNGSSSTRLNTSHVQRHPYTCQTCAKRKVKCDKIMPKCSSCNKARIDCSYSAPGPRARRPKVSSEMLERLARYERTLRRHGLLEEADQAFASEYDTQEVKSESISFHWNRASPPTAGKLMPAAAGKTRYIDSSLWRSLEEGGASDDEDDGSDVGVAAQGFAADPLTASFLGHRQSVLDYHPPPETALLLWQTHANNVEPLCKILHLPSTAEMVKKVSHNPISGTDADACLLFAVYHFAVSSMTNDDCMDKLGMPRKQLLEYYNFAARQALVNASFLRTSDFVVLQALVLFLMACRHTYDAHTYWALTGVAVRISQRMGLHKDGDTLGLPPFDVQMRRRLFYQLLPLEGMASQMSGIELPIVPDAWNTKPPLNINDDQIWPGMTEVPEPQTGATEMLFCLSRACMGTSLLRIRSNQRPLQFKDSDEAKRAIDHAESEIELRYIRYCDISNPLHFLAMGLGRCGITAMRLRARLPSVRAKTASETERRDVLQLAFKILDTDIAVYANTGVKRYWWYVRPMFLWGTWDALILVLATLREKEILSPDEVVSAWDRIQRMYENHGKPLIESKRAFHGALARLVLRAWEANPSRSCPPEPSFISGLRSARDQKFKSQSVCTFDNDTPEDGAILKDFESVTVAEKPGLGEVDEFKFDDTDWAFFDELMRNHQA